MDASLYWEDVKEFETKASNSSGKNTIVKIVSARKTGRWTDFFLFEQCSLYSLPKKVACICSVKVQHQTRENCKSKGGAADFDEMEKQSAKNAV